MVSLRFCGPKLSICCSILSVWGIIMLVLLGIFLGVYSAAFAEDLALEEILGKPDFVLRMKNEYTQNSYNCLIAACLYVLSFASQFGSTISTVVQLQLPNVVSLPW